MSETLLQTKLHVPPLRPDVVSRPQLVARLNEGIQQGYRLTLVSAPAGFGKTTLVSSWLSQLITDKVAWLSLDEADNDPIRFLAYFTAALQKIAPGLDAGIPTGSALSLLPPLDRVMAHLINEIIAFPQRLILVLDDYHLIKAQPIHAAIVYLLDHLPANMHLVIVTRIDPPLSISRLRSRGQLTELRLDDLRFELGETTAFLAQTTGHELATNHVSALTNRTEGWIAGLQLAAVSMRQQKEIEIANFVRAFTGSHRYVMDYLIEEVLEGQPRRVQQFLLQTSILERFTAPLCDVVVQPTVNKRPADADDLAIDNSQTILEQLERSNLFIIPLDEERRWYRYHRLFADLLRKRLSQIQPDQVPILHDRASKWFEQTGQMESAIEHALSGESFERAADLIEQATEKTLMRSEITTFLKWMDILPEEFARSRPDLCLYYDCARMISGRPISEGTSYFQEAEMADGSSPGQVAALKALIAMYHGRLTQAIEMSRKALAILPEDSRFLRNLNSFIMALSPLESDDFTASMQAIEEFVQMGQRMGNVIVSAGALCVLGKLSRVMGRLHEATAYYQQALETATDGEGRPYPAAGIALIGLGELKREADDLETAEQHLTRGLALIKEMRVNEALDGYLSLALLRQAQGDPDGARNAIQEAQQLLLNFDTTETDKALVDAHQAQLWLTQGNIKGALGWAKKHGLTPDAVMADLEEADETGALIKIRRKRRWVEYITLARLWITLEKPVEMLPFLRRLRQFEERMGLHGRLIGVLTIQALTLQAVGEIEQATATLERALSLAEPEGYVRIFLDEGPAMANLLRRVISSNPASDYANRLLMAFNDTKGERQKDDLRKIGSQPLPTSPQAIVEPLSEREMEVLRLLETNLSVPEIAEQLFIAPSTARSHIKHIYGKLAVHRRWEAVAKAKELGLF